MSKQIIVRNCEECPHRHYNEDYGYYECSEIGQMEESDLIEIPAVCPLPAYIADTSKKVCKWEHTGPTVYGDGWRFLTACGELHDTNYSIENFNFCPYCGGKIEVVK